MKLDVIDRTPSGAECSPVARAILDREEEIDHARNMMETLKERHLEEIRRLAHQIRISEEVLRALRAGENALP